MSAGNMAKAFAAAVPGRAGRPRRVSLALRTPGEDAVNLCSELCAEVRAGRPGRAVDALNDEGPSIGRSPLLQELARVLAEDRADRLAGLAADDSDRVALSALWIDPHCEARIVIDEATARLHLRRQGTYRFQTSRVQTLCGKRMYPSVCQHAERGQWERARRGVGALTLCESCAAHEAEIPETSERADAGMPREMRNALRDGLLDIITEKVKIGAFNLAQAESAVIRDAAGALLGADGEAAFTRILTDYRDWRKNAGAPLAGRLSVADWAELFAYAHDHAAGALFKDVMLRWQVQKALEGVLSMRL